MTQRHSKEQFETAQKIDQEYSRYFTGKGVGPASQELGLSSSDIHS